MSIMLIDIECCDCGRVTEDVMKDRNSDVMPRCPVCNSDNTRRLYNKINFALGSGAWFRNGYSG